MKYFLLFPFFCPHKVWFIEKRKTFEERTSDLSEIIYLKARVFSKK
jgi:hypothetical protein